MNLNAQVNDIWIQTPPLGIVMPFPTPYYKASLKLDISEGQFISNRPLLRISGIETSGGSRNVKLFMNSGGNLGLGSSSPTSILQLNKTTTKQGILSLSYKSTTGSQINSSEIGINTTNNSYWIGGAYAIGGTNSMFNPG